MALASVAQATDPLKLDLCAYPLKLSLAVVQPEVLVKAAQHQLQLLLLVTFLPVRMLA